MTKFRITYTFSLFIFLLFSCKNNNQSARKPIDHSRQKVDMESVQNNRDLNKREEEYIKKMITDDTLSYQDSGHGFWFAYIRKNNRDTIPVQTGDKVLLTYEISDLSNNIIYSFDEIGEKKYWVDHENYFRGFREAVKILKQGEEALFVFPSGAAYGYHGDEKKIGSSVPLKMKLKIIEIYQQKEE